MSGFMKFSKHLGFIMMSADVSIDPVADFVKESGVRVLKIQIISKMIWVVFQF